MSKFQINDKVMLNGKEYKIVGTVKRSFKLERDGKFYKATANKMEKIENQNSLGIGVGRKERTKKSDTYYMERRIAWRSHFDENAKIPETEDELMNHLGILAGELSPENLCCDGELSRTAVKQKLRELKAEWKEVEKKLGRKVSEYEADDHFMSYA